jgi:alpha-D-xyloside xylohydrolase
MALEVGAEEQGTFSECDDQFMVGDSLLVAPLFAGQAWRDVTLPNGDWFDFETGARLRGGRSHRLFVSLETLPMFVRDGGVIPLMPAFAHAPRVGERVPLEVRHYGTAGGSFDLYDDDGETCAYEAGAFRWLRLQAAQEGDILSGANDSLEGSSFSVAEWVFLGCNSC